MLLSFYTPHNAESNADGEREMEAQVEAASEATIVTLQLSATASLETTQEASVDSIFRF